MTEQPSRTAATTDSGAYTQQKLPLAEDENEGNEVRQQREMEQFAEHVGRKDRQLPDETVALIALQQKHECEKAVWRSRAERNEQQLQQLTDTHQETIMTLKGTLEASEHRVAVLTAQLGCRSSRMAKDSPHTSASTLDALVKENTGLTRQLTEFQAEVGQLKEAVKSEKSEVYKWKDLVKELRSLLDGRNLDMDRKREEVRATRESLRNAQQDHELTKDRLQRGIDENETLSTQLRELQRQLQSHDKRTSSTPSMYSSREKFSSRRQLPRLDSLSDLSNVDFSIDPDMLDKESLTDEYCDVRARLERSISEIHALRRELRESQSSHDALHLTHIQLGQDLSKQRQDADAQLCLMTDRVQDLTNKLTNSEKQVRLLKTKMTRAESRDRRRSHSLKGKDTFGLGKDVDQKLSQLEAKIEQLMPKIETGVDESSTSTTLGEDSRACEEQSGTNTATRGALKHSTRRSKSFDDPSKAGRLRRKSLDSSAANSDGVNAALRINDIEAKVAALTPSRARSPQTSPVGSPLRSPPTSRHSKTRGSSERSGKAKRTEVVRNTSDLLPAADTLSLVCAQLCECVEWLDTHRCSCGSNSELSSLQQRLSSVHQLAAGTSQTTPASISPLAERLQPVAQQMLQLLQQKIMSLAERRQNLKAANSWTKEAQLKNFAERIAYETVLLSQVSQALSVCNQSNNNLDSVKLQDLMESHRKMSFLEKKLTNPEFDLDTMAPLEFYTSMLAEKLVVTGEVLSCMNNSNRKPPDPRLDATCRDLQGRLLDRERQLARLVTSYKEEKLHEIAVVMAQELSNSTPQDDSVLMEEVRIREAWSSAHQLLIQEIVNHQSSQSLLRITHLLKAPSSNSTPLNDISSLSLTLCSAEAIDRLQTGAEESLRQEMEEAVLTLSQKYEEVLAQYRLGDTSLINSVSASMEDVLNEFAAVMAQKALIDGHLALLQEEFDIGSMQTTQDSLIISEDSKDPIESAGEVLDSEAHLLMFLGARDTSVESIIRPALSHAEFTYLFNKTSSESNTDINNLLVQLLSQKSEDVPELVTMLASSSSYRSSTRSLHQASPFASDRDQDILEQPQLRSAASMSKIHQPSPKARRKSETRKSRRSSDITGMTSLGCRQCEELRQELNNLKKKLQLQNTVEERRECVNCPKLLDTIEKLEESQRANLSRFESSDSDEQLMELKQRLLLLEEGYESQISELKRHYEDALSSHPDSCDEVMRLKYQTEIEHLRGLCEKGLGTMEGSQGRIVAELKESHRRDLVLLQAEKDQALAEETQATLAALDAMRKAHEAEVQKEVAKLQVDFLRRLQGGQDIGQLTQQHEYEMQDIRREILSLSEKYSTKCLESANLEAKIENLNKQLGEAAKTAHERETRNTKLKTQLTEKIDAMKSGVSAGGTETELRLRNAEAAVKDDKLAKLGIQLQKAQTNLQRDTSSSSKGRRVRNYGDPKSSPAKN
uniref:Protein outspread isoform X1 n=1 Tax=Hirondellea gigas TaxID=1518452 RepID=A0A6A7FU42_9CRUS